MYQKYEQMAMLGVPLDRILMAIQVDGVDPSQFVYRAPQQQPQPYPQRYQDMLNSGIDQRAVLQRMLADGQDPNSFHLFRTEEELRSDKRYRGYN
ncbi:hypothetical protein BASA81_009792 [Batrachochytrium salamandrivorans]|nr:hypothetical protein BASA81_009792 [Batrachochytrium salamandrivorans]